LILKFFVGTFFYHSFLGENWSMFFYVFGEKKFFYVQSFFQFK
jgi:hypothetical protein